MPCTDDRDERDTHVLLGVACELARAIRSGDSFESLTPMTQAWVLDHEENDARNKFMELHADQIKSDGRRWYWRAPRVTPTWHEAFTRESAIDAARKLL